MIFVGVMTKYTKNCHIFSLLFSHKSYKDHPNCMKFHIERFCNSLLISNFINKILTIFKI